MDDTQKILEEKVDSAPKEIRELIVSARWSSVVEEISKKNNFSADQKTSLENETLFILIGLELKKDFKENIKRELYIPDILARDISDEIEERVFKQVNDFLPTSMEGEGPVVTQTPNVTQKVEVNSPSQNSAVIGGAPSVTESNLPVERPSLDILQKQSELPATSLEQTLSQKVATGENPVVEKKYYPGQDPYREPPI